MKQIIIYLVSVLLLFGSCVDKSEKATLDNQESNPPSQSSPQKEVKKYKNQDVDNKSCLTRKNGTCRETYKDGTLKSWSVYHSGILKYYEEYYQNSRLKSLYTYDFKDSTGLLKKYYESGNIKFLFKYKKGLAVSGEEYYESGSLLSIYNYEKGKANGWARILYEDGIVWKRLLFELGNLILEEEYYYKGGLKRSHSYRNNKKHGFSRKFYKDGTQEELSVYEEGKLIKYPLYDAIEKGDLKEVKNLMENGFNLLYNKDGLSPVMYSVKYGRLEILKYLISKGEDIYRFDSPEILPLHYAAKTGQTEIVDFFINDPKNIENRSNQSGKTPLYAAACNNRMETVKLLLSKGAKLNIKNSKGKVCSPFICAINAGYFEMGEFLLKKGAIVGLTDPSNTNILLKPAEYGRLDVVKFWVEKGVTVNSLDSMNESALLKAARKGHYEVVKYLLSQGAKTDVRSKIGTTPYKVALNNHHTKIASLIKRYQSKQ